MFALAAAVALAAPLSMNAKNESLVLGGGCFWCTEAAYELLPGVKSVVSGYSGGKELNPTYEQISAKVTGHAEVIKIEFDPAVVSLEKVLDFFWQVHNPTQVGGQGNDKGPHYRSIILFADAAQKAAAEKASPPAQPSQLLAGLMLGAILWRPNGTPMSRPPTSVNLVATTTQMT